jgi:hypothetical protein
MRRPIGPSQGERLFGALCVFGHVFEAADGGAAVRSNSERPENMLGVEDGMYRPADVDWRRDWSLLATAMGSLSTTE